MPALSRFARACALCLPCLFLPPALAQTAPPQVDESALRAHLALLSSDLFEGRGTGQRGGDLTVAYLETQARVLGLRPAAGESYRQAVKLVGIQAQSDGLRAVAQGKELRWQDGRDWLPGSDLDSSSVFDHPLLFVGYGIHAPQENWDDYKDVDCKGKILLMLSGEPQPTAQAPQRFAGAALSYFGRRSYKAEEALRRGAAGVIFIHTEANALTSWSVLANGQGEHFKLDDGKPGLALQAWLSEAASAELLQAAGLDLKTLHSEAESGKLQARALALRLQGRLQVKARRLEQYNIAALIPGTDPQLKHEWVIYSAHWDHLGRKEGSQGDLIFNGAVDNASGTASLLAMAQAAVRHPGKRSQLFLWVAAEEQGLLGSAWYAAHPLTPLGKTAANLNLDTMNFVGRTRDISVFGSERSDLHGYAAQVARSMGLELAPPRVDTHGVYFRSDHFSFAKAGVPAFSVGSGSQYLQADGGLKRKGYGARYHQASDEYDPAWDLSGMREQAQFTLNLGRALADAPALPQWKPGDPFAKAR
ncbi:M28 family peptidase [Massilia sp. W12]|uniref:M28 family peptidase n=1 Tax=Massilia sp. W12 TaxID=3126507 RepID=UPI0030CA9763